MAFDKIRKYLNVEYQPGERKLVQKVDFFILTFCCLSYLVNYVSAGTRAPVALWSLVTSPCLPGCSSTAPT